MKKEDLKKLALLGLAGGAILGCQNANAEQPREDSSTILAASAHGCGSGCGGQAGKARYNYTADASHSCGNANSSCGHAGKRRNTQTAQAEQPVHSCGAHSCNSTGGTTTTDQNLQNRARQRSQYYQGTGTQSTQGTETHSTQPGTQQYTPSSNQNPSGTEGSQTPGQGSGGKLSGMDYFYHNPNRYTADNDVNATSTNSATDQSTRTSNLTESQLFSQLNEQSKATFRSLTPEGKRLALQLASQYADKNEAVRVAAQRSGEQKNSWDQKNNSRY